jgi:lysophospholipase L1-like esterase
VARPPRVPHLDVAKPQTPADGADETRVAQEKEKPPETPTGLCLCLAIVKTPLFVVRVLSDASVILLAPVLLAQGWRVRRVTPRLPPAQGPSTGTTGAGPHPIRLLLIGESTAVSVGAPDHTLGLVGQTARALHRQAGRAVCWRVLGRSGASARELLAEFIAPARSIEADIVVVILGVNDTIGLSSPRAWTAALDALLECLRRRAPAVPVVLAAVPPMQYFPAIPSPLRHVLGLKSHVLDRAAIRWARSRPAVAHVPHPQSMFASVSEAFCSDGFHPSVVGYQYWGEALASAAAALLH